MAWFLCGKLGMVVSKVITNGFWPANGEGGIVMGFAFLGVQG